MDDTDRKLISELQVDPRKSSAKLARSLDITERTVSKRINRLVSSGELVFTAFPDMKRFGFPTSSYIGIRLEKPSKAIEVAERLCQLSQLRFVSVCEGFADIFIRGEFTSNESLAFFVTNNLAKIEGISRIDTMVELSHVKQLTWELQHRDNVEMPTINSGEIHVDATDMYLISELQKDSRVPLKKLARQIDINESTVYRRINNLVKSGAIELKAIPNFSRIGCSTHGFVLIEAELPKLVEVAQSIASHSQISTVGIYSGPIQILAGIHISSPQDFLELLTVELLGTPGVIRLDTLIHLKVYKQNFFWLQQ
jgi:DNA-binding Lrp family transcriptional regulator